MYRLSTATLHSRCAGAITRAVPNISVVLDFVSIEIRGVLAPRKPVIAAAELDFS
jgi:hypothetical protein